MPSSCLPHRRAFPANNAAGPETGVNTRLRTGDIMQPGKTLVSCDQMGEAVTQELDKLAGV